MVELLLGGGGSRSAPWRVAHTNVKDKYKTDTTLVGVGVVGAWVWT